jgi:hypothetical protein
MILNWSLRDNNFARGSFGTVGANFVWQSIDQVDNFTAELTGAASFSGSIELTPMIIVRRRDYPMSKLPALEHPSSGLE